MVLSYTDNIMHVRPGNFMKGGFHDVMKRLDELIHYIMKNFDLIIYASDHDFRPYNTILNIKYILVKYNLLKYFHKNKFIDKYLNYKLPRIFYNVYLWKITTNLYNIIKNKLKIIKNTNDNEKLIFPTFMDYDINSRVIPANYPYVLKSFSNNATNKIISIFKKEYNELLSRKLINIIKNKNYIFIHIKDESLGVRPGYFPIKKSIVKLNGLIYDHGIYGFAASYFSNKNYL